MESEAFKKQYEHEGYSGKICPECKGKLIINDLGCTFCEECDYSKL